MRVKQRERGNFCNNIRFLGLIMLYMCGSEGVPKKSIFNQNKHYAFYYLIERGGGTFLSKYFLPLKNISKHKYKNSFKFETWIGIAILANDLLLTNVLTF